MRAAEPSASGRSASVVAWLVRHSGAVLLAALVLGVLAATSLLRLRLDVDLLSMLPQGRERFADYQRYVARFGAQDVAVAVVRAPDPATAIRFTTVFEEELGSAPEVAGVRSHVDLRAFAAALRAGALPRLLPLEEYPELERRLSPEGVAAAVRDLRRVLAAPASVGSAGFLAGDPLGLGALLADSLSRTRPDRALSPGSEYLLSPDGKRVLLLIRPAERGYDTESAERLARALRGAEERARESSGTGDEVSVGYTGAFAFAIEDAALLRSDMLLYSVLALLGVLAAFALGFRSLAFVPLLTVQLLLVTLLTFALGLAIEGRLNAISLAFAVIFYGLSIDAAIHFYSRFLEEWGGAGPVEPALGRTVAALLPATTIAATTSAAAFAVIGFSAFAGVSQLGLLTTLGMLLNVPATFVLLPALIAWSQGHTRLLRARSDLGRFSRLGGFAEAIARHRGAAAAATLAAVVLAIVAARGTWFDTNLFHLRPASSSAARVQAELEEHFGLVDPAGAVLIETPRDGDPELDDAALVAAERVTAALATYRGEGRVESVLSPSPLLPSRATQEARLAAWAALPREDAASRLAVELRAAGFRLDPFADAIDALRRVPTPVDPTREPLPGLELLAERHLRHDSGGLAVLIPFHPRDRSALEEVAERLPREVDPGAARVTVTGRPLMELELHRAMRLEIVWFVVAVALSNAVLIWTRVRDLRVTGVVLAVPALAVLLLLALLGATGQAIDPVTLVVFPLTVGLGVDNCIYLAERCRETGSVGEAVASTGRPLAITAATTTIGFGVLALARYPALAGLGRLAAVGIVLCFVVTLLVVPAALPPRWFRSRVHRP